MGNACTTSRRFSRRRAAHAAIHIVVLVAGLYGFGAGLCTPAQVLELSGGSSSLYQAEGGTLVLHGGAYESEISGGVIGGRLVGGGRLAYHRKQDTYSAGIEELRFNLPTDLFNGDHRLLGVGVGYQTRREATSVEAFAGAASTRFDTPLFRGVRATGASAALLMSHSISPSVTFTTQALAASSTTVLQAVQWKSKPWLVMAAAGGVGGTKHYSAVSVDVKRTLVDVRAAYISVGKGFERIGSQPGVTAEPVRENLLFTVRSSRFTHLSFSAGRQNSVIPAGTVTSTTGSHFVQATPTDLVSTSNQLSGSSRFRSVSVTGSLFHSSFNGQSNVAVALSAARQVNPRVRVQTSYFQSSLLHGSSLLQGPSSSRSLVTNVQEVLNRRLTANQTISYSNGQATIGYGGSVLSNILTVSADYETFYVPTRPGNPFEQTLVLDVQLNLFGRVSVHAGTFVSPTGKLLYSADAHGVESRLPVPKQPSDRMHFGADILEGRVVDTTGAPVFGAALDIGGNLVYTDSDGAFLMRDSRPRAYVLKVLLDQFLDGHRYKVVSQPVQVISTNPGKREPGRKVEVVVQRDDPPTVQVANSCTGSGSEEPGRAAATAGFTFCVADSSYAASSSEPAAQSALQSGSQPGRRWPLLSSGGGSK